MNINNPFTLYYGLIAAIPTEWKKILNQNNLHLNALLEDLPSTLVACAACTSKEQRKSTDIREQDSKLRFFQRNHPQSVLVAFPNNQRFEINCVPV